MIEFFLKIYDFLVKRKWLAGLVAVLLALAGGLLATRLHYEEDITRFLPSDELSSKYSDAYNALGKKNNIILIFSPKDSLVDEYSIKDAIYGFEEALEVTGPVTGLERQITVDQSAALDMMDAVMAKVPLYMTEADYGRIDSLLNDEYIINRLEEDRRSLQFPSGEMVVRYIQSDPLGLFSPLLQRLRSSAANVNYVMIDDCIFTKDGKGLAFLTSPYGMSESGMNSKVAGLVQAAVDRTEAANPEVEISAVGAPLIAVANAARIKKDSIMAISIALILIGLLLILAYRRFSDIAWIAVSIAFGWIFAIGAIALIRDSISIIVLGIASVIIGIAVNYPLHYMDGFKAGVSPRMNLKEMVTPLLIGNITTIAAFLCLVWLDAVAMQDLGLFGSLMLAGTIIFTLVFLPVFARQRKKDVKTLELGRILPDRVPASGWVFLSVTVLTVVFFFLGKRTGFDSDMQAINYMTSEQRAGLKLLEDGLEQEGYSRMYAIAEGTSLEDALRFNDELRRKMDSCAGISFVKGVGNFLPSLEEQQRRISRWNEHWSGGRAEALEAGLVARADEAGFSDGAFQPFLDILKGDFNPEEFSDDSPSFKAFDGTYVIKENGKYLIVNQVYYKEEAPSSSAEVIKEELKTDGVLVFDTGDISSRLVKVLSGSFDYIGLICSMVVFVFLLLSFRNIEISLMSFLPLAVSWFWILGIMGLSDIRFNIVNIILATFIFGQGDDYTIFITEGLIYEYAYGKKRLATYKNSIFHSAVIMFIGIGVLAFAKHPAMKSLGVVTVIGMFIVVMMAYYLPPVIFRWLTEKKGVKRDVPITLKRLGYSAFSLVSFVLLMFFVVYPYTFFHFLGKDTEEKKLRYHSFIQRVSKFLISHVPGVEYNVSGTLTGSGTGEKPAVIVCNHQSHLDLACLMALTPKIVFFTNDWVWKNPIYGYVIRKAEYYPVADGLDRNLGRIRDLVERGYSLAVFPEGTRTSDGKIGRFHKGAFYVASELGLDIIPVFIHGADHVLPKRDFMLREGRIDVDTGSRISPSGDYRQLTKNIHHFYLNHFEELRRKFETPGYLSLYVRYKYLYKGSDVASRTRKALAAIAVAPLPPACSATTSGRVEIRNCGQGEYSLIYALMHPEVEVYAFDPDEENIMLASNCSNLPSNLHYQIESE